MLRLNHFAIECDVFPRRCVTKGFIAVFYTKDFGQSKMDRMIRLVDFLRA